MSGTMRMPLEPLVTYLRIDNPNDLATKIGVTDTTVRRWYAGGLTLEACDRVAVQLGLHPILLWGDEWRLAEEADLARLDERRSRRNQRNAGYRRNREARACQ